MTPYDIQDNILRSEAEITVVAGGRGSGKDCLCWMWLMRHWLNVKKDALLLSSNQDMAGRSLEEYRAVLRSEGETPFEFNPDGLTLQLYGAIRQRCLFWSIRSSALVGIHPSAVVFDEIHESQEDDMMAWIEKFRSDGAKILVIGTPGKEDSSFHGLWECGLMGFPEIRSYLLPSTMNPHFPKECLDQAQSVLSGRGYRRTILARFDPEDEMMTDEGVPENFVDAATMRRFF